MHNPPQRPANATCTIELTVQNHPGVMVHVANLFARRAFNLEGILCGPLAGAQVSRMLLRVGADVRIDQVLRHLEKLHDVIEVLPRPDLDARPIEALFSVPQRPEERTNQLAQGL
jgi:acetolactate synthase-1/3 small subunit